MNYGVDRYKRPQKISLQEEKARQKSREEYLQSREYAVAHPAEARRGKAIESARRYPSEPQENLLYFMEKNARCSNRGSARSCASCVKSASISTRRNRPR
nr:SpoVR family protein [Klebsiella pneumoniae]